MPTYCVAHLHCRQNTKDIFSLNKDEFSSLVKDNLKTLIIRSETKTDNFISASREALESKLNGNKLITCVATLNRNNRLTTLNYNGLEHDFGNPITINNDRLMVRNEQKPKPAENFELHEPTQPKKIMLDANRQLPTVNSDHIHDL
ncbi:hypothetical protein L3V82_12595 [Thiotrichales bacterium 19S3-7]|nr:hypothetical protein [Thiotrichales bacterium 19S3-7]MCF6802783.1 hypothetical protein [Thiotrichales bacterium 19S3-11]